MVSLRNEKLLYMYIKFSFRIFSLKVCLYAYTYFGFPAHCTASHITLLIKHKSHVHSEMKKIPWNICMNNMFDINNIKKKKKWLLKIILSINFWRLFSGKWICIKSFCRWYGTRGYLLYLFSLPNVLVKHPPTYF